MADIFLPDSSDDQGYILSVYENSLTEDESSNEVSSSTATTTSSSDENSNNTPPPDNAKHVEQEANTITEQSPEAEESSEERKEEGMDVDDPLNPFSSVKEELEHLLGMVESEYIHIRQMAIRKMLGCLERASSNPENLQMAISIMYKLSEDDENLVRSELIQHVPSFALFCQSHSDETRRVVRQHLVPYTVKLLNDTQIGVRKLGQAALVGLLLEGGMIDKSQLSEWICPLVSQLASCDSNLEELRIEDVNLMTKLIPFVGRDITIKFFLEPFTTLCGDPSFGIRKVCAMDFGGICRVVGTETTEASLIRVFTDLCGDAAWGIRKACADVFVEVASIVTLKTRKEVLPHLFISLLNDYSQYVKYTAYQALGKFIFTFADPASSGLALVKGRVVRLHPVEQDSNNNQEETACHTPTPPSLPPPSPPHKPKESVSVSSKDEHVFVHVGEGSYNEFQYWRTPLPEVELDIDLDGGGATNILVRAKAPSGGGTSEIKVRIAPASGNGEVQVQTARINTISTSQEQEVSSSRYEEATYSFRENYRMDVNSIKVMGRIEPLTTQLRDEPSFLLSSKELEEKPLLMTPYDQDIVPPELLSRFISVAGQHFPVYDFSMKQSEEERIGCCAFSFPAVALTLGSHYWPCLQPTCDKLAKDTKWTIRKTIASSLHELATILGPDLTAKDLLPIFLDLLKDVDEVRMKLIQHLHDFLAPLQPIWRRMFLPIIEEFCRVDNVRNWRFRCTVAEQLCLAVELFDSFEVMKYFLPIALGCVEDRVSAVRVAGVQFVAVILKHMMKEECTKRDAHTLLEDLTHYLDSPKWVYRQMYVLLCEQFVVHSSIPEEMFAELVAPQLVCRAWDNVPNVRLALSRCLANTLKPRGFLPSIQKVKPDLFKQVMYKLDADVDDDVRHFAKLLTTTEKETPLV